MRHAIPVCPDCGAALPHGNPMAWEFHMRRLYGRFFDEAVERGRALGRPFTEDEVLSPAWEEGYELTMQMDSRFVLVREATGKTRRLWGLREQEGAKDGNG